MHDPIPDADRPPRTLAALAEAAAAHPFERKQVVAARAGAGRELLRQLVSRAGGWLGFEVTTPHRLAQELVATELAAEALGVADEFDEVALLDAAMDAVLQRMGGAGTTAFAVLAEGAGLRRAVAASVRALRLAGFSAADLRRVRLRDEQKREQLAAILEEYEAQLASGGLTDGAGVLARAIRGLEAGDAALSRIGRLYVLPDQVGRGLAGRFIALLVRRGAEVLPADPVFGLDRPAGLMPEAGPLRPAAAHAAGASPLTWLHDPAGWQATAGSRGAAVRVADDAQAAPGVPAGDVVLDLFAATSLAAELREVLRRALAAGLRWDEIEIIATDAVAYGVALDGLARRLDIPVTYAVGLPLVRTRPGRAVAHYLRWVDRGQPAELLRQMLEQGDLAADAGVSGAALARRLRRLRPGTGRVATAAALERLELVLARVASATEDPDVGEDDGAMPGSADTSARAADEALAGLLRHLLAATPAAEPGGAGWSPGGLAAGALAVLERVPLATAADRAAAARLTPRLERIRAALQRPTTLAAASAVIAAELEGRVPPPDGTGAAPWSASGGHLHLSDLEHGGWTGRPATFIVGLDAARFPGPPGSDALLVDEDRRRLSGLHGEDGSAALRTEADRGEEKRYALGALVARLRGRVTFSYPTWDAVEARGLAPASELLQVHRLISGDPAADYEALHAAAAPAASPVPRGGGLIDAADVWLHVLAHDPGGRTAGAAAVGSGALRRGVTTVCALFPGLAAGAAAWRDRRRSGTPTAHHGMIAPRPQLDPRSDAAQVVSPTRLETLGACPHRYLLRYVLRVPPPPAPEPPPDRWLAPQERGSLLHAVFDRSLRDADADSLDFDGDAFVRRVLDILDDAIEQARLAVPPPGETVFAAERERLRDDARAFVAMVREDGRRHIALERAFGRDGAEPVEIALPDGSTLRLAGRIDRVDELPDGALLVIDYKTGSSLRYGPRSGPLDGGRRLQHVLYAAAANRLFDRPVAGAEYHFPSRRSENYRARFGAQQLRDGLAVVVDLLELVRAGWFVPTNDPEDCRFCDYAAVCRASVDAFGKVDSQPAAWAREAEGPALDVLRRLRR